MTATTARLGAHYLGDGRCSFVVWAPRATTVDLHLVAPEDCIVALDPSDRGYFQVIVDGVAPGARYFYRLGGPQPTVVGGEREIKERTDPASRFQPDGVHQASVVIDPRFAWTDQGWRGHPLAEYVLYELHVGTFTPEGTFDAIVPHLDSLVDLGITAIELMPVAQFPGSRNWGYDGTYPFAAHASYGGPEGLKRLVNAAHERGLAVVLDVVYNHLGPEGNYLNDYGPYFTDRYRTPWGSAVNFDGPDSDEVRRYFGENALGWLEDFHVDALRLDAVHAIRDFSAQPFLEELAIAVEQLADRIGRRLYLIAESDLNDARLIRSRELGGYGLSAQWSDDFHHALHALLTGESSGYYSDFGQVAHLAQAFRASYVYAGDFAPHRGRRHGNSARGANGQQFVVCSQNHDQIGNRMLGDRFGQNLPFESLKLAAGTVLLSPFVPLLFMGEEYGEKAPFQYFTSHGDHDLIEAVRQGRAAEFAAFRWQGEVPDPQDEATFHRSKLRHELKNEVHHHTLREFYRELLRLRRELPALANLSMESLETIAFEKHGVLYVHRWLGHDHTAALFNYASTAATITAPILTGNWRKEIDSADERWLGAKSTVAYVIRSDGEARLKLPPRSFVLMVRESL